MSNRKQADSKPAPLSESQKASPETMSPEELARRRAEVAALAAEARQRRGHELLAEGARLLGQRRPGEASSRLAEAAELLPANVDVAINLGGAYILQGKYDKAVSVLEQATSLAPANAMLWVNLAAAHLGSLELSGPRQQERAIAAYQRALEIDPATPNVHYNLGLIYKDRQDWAKARDHFTAALGVDAGDADALTWLDTVARMEQQVQAADPPGPEQPGPEDPEASQGDMP
jgi:tetratricopeptide (TPR) repeat protein